jgi:hypothetical protein
MARRAIPAEMLEAVVQQPQQIVVQPGGQKVYQSQVVFGSGKTFLLRAFVDDRVEPAVVVTVYRTSKINKYWRQS